MKTEKMEENSCSEASSNCASCGGMSRGIGKFHMYMLLGTLAVVYGLINYFMTVLGWTTYMAWMVGGALLISVGLVKKYCLMKCSC